jgi:ribosome-associated heat shock protein Hsp15
MSGVNREKIDQPSAQIKPGDVLTISLERGILVLKILGCGHRRGPASEAQLLYEDLDAETDRGKQGRYRRGAT